jgi:hypothetical protein
LKKIGIVKVITNASNAGFFRAVVNINLSTLAVIPNKRVNCLHDTNASVPVSKIHLPKKSGTENVLPHLDRTEISVRAPN